MILINNQDRSKLGEGRNYGMGFSICKQTDENTIETIIPITACKDYLNDVVYNELTNKEIAAYGLKITKKTNLLDNERFWIVTKILDVKGGTQYAKQSEDEELLKNNRENLLNFINQIEQKIKIDTSEFLTCENDENIIAINAPIFWMQGTYLISLYTLLLRVGLYYKGEDVMEYLKDFKHRSEEVYMIKNILPKLEKLFNNYVPKTQDFGNKVGTAIHNYGICTATEI